MTRNKMTARDISVEINIMTYTAVKTVVLQEEIFKKSYITMIKVRVTLTKTHVHSEVSVYRLQWRPVTILHSETSRRRPVRSVLDRLRRRAARRRFAFHASSNHRFLITKTFCIINKTVYQWVCYVLKQSCLRFSVHVFSTSDFLHCNFASCVVLSFVTEKLVSVRVPASRVD